MKEFKPGAIEVYGEADWRMGQLPDVKKAKHNFRDNEIQYSQLDTGATDCTLYASMGAISDLTGKIWTLEERDLVHKRALEQGLDPETGRWLYLAVDLVRTIYGKVSSLRVGIDSDDFREALDLGYSVVTGYKGNKSYSLDSQDNCVLDNVEIGPSTYGHAIRVTKKGDEIYVVDNYKGVLTCNVYQHKVFKEQVAKGIFFSYGFIYIPLTSMDEYTNLPPHIRPDQVDNAGMRETIKAWEQDLGQAIEDGYELYFTNFIDGGLNVVYPKMVVELMEARKYLKAKTK